MMQISRHLLRVKSITDTRTNEYKLSISPIQIAIVSLTKFQFCIAGRFFRKKKEPNLSNTHEGTGPPPDTDIIET